MFIINNCWSINACHNFNMLIYFLCRSAVRIQMSRRRNFPHDNVQYTRLSGAESDYLDEQFDYPPPKVPWKAIILSTILSIGGFILLLVGILIVTGHIDAQYQDRMHSMIVLGAIMFLPGAYHLRIAFCAFRNIPGYSYDDIPEFD